MRANTARFAAAAAGAALILASCSSSKSTATHTSTPPTQGGTSSSQAATGPVITIAGFAYSGQLTVKPGEKITVKNNDSADHTLTDKVNHKFDSGDVPGGGGTKTITAPSTPGTYNFGCSFHPQMHGTLIVKS